jgi:hypothetical protein
MQLSSLSEMCFERKPALTSMQILFIYWGSSYITPAVFTKDRAKWVIQWRFALFEPLRAPYISA